LSTHDFDPDSSAPREFAHRRWVRLGMLSAAALLLHAAALGGLDWGWPATEPAVLTSAAMQVRVVDLPPEPRPAGAPMNPSPPVAIAEPTPAAAPPVRVRSKLVPARVPAAAAPAPQAVAPPLDAEAPRVATSATLLAANTASAPAAAPPPADDEAIPHYRTQMPPAMTLRYEVQRGVLHGTGDLAWRPQGEHYELKLEFKLSGLVILSQASSGAFDSDGIAPLRFTDQRLRRAATAANFQRAADKISYSGSSKEFPLRAGAQDRLSWMVQLAAIVAADPRLAKPEAKVVMAVTGSHADLGVWVFRCIGPDAVAARGGSIDAIKFVREPREAYDTTVQVWLDPQHHDLPVRATQKSGEGDEGYELRLLEVLPAN
jgi:hypothetical protein